MNWLRRISLSMKAAVAVARFLKDVQKAGKERLSPENARHDRRLTEDWLLDFLTNRADKGLYGLIDLDNDAAVYAQHYLKSRHIEQANERHAEMTWRNPPKGMQL